MSLNDFTDRMAAAMKKRLGDGCQVSMHTVRKNNGITMTGLTFQCGESNISPTVYMNPYYDRVERLEMGFDDAVDEAVRTYQENCAVEDFDASQMLDYEKAKTRLRAKLINTDRNRDFLSDVPHREFLDLSLIYTVMVDCGGMGEGTVTVNHRHMEMWGVTEQELYEQAKANMEAADNLTVMNISEVLQEASEMEMPEETSAAAVPMCVISTRDRRHGAVAMMSRETMRKAAGIVGRDFVIFPSSIHEVIAVPAFFCGGGAEHLACMVREINRTEVLEEEVLSDHVYRYDSRTGDIAIAA